jgi:hypothetical protein
VIVVCHFCGRRVDPNSRFLAQRGTAWKIAGVGDQRRGGRDVIGFEADGVLAHRTCVERERSGVAIGQEQLL